MAALNYSGLFLASKRIVQDQDDYEEDAEIDANPNEIDKKASYIYYKPLNEWKKQKEWNYKLNDGESVEAIASGSGWCACYTDQGYLRIFSQTGVQKQVIHQSSIVVSMTGYENHLVVVYHGGLPIYDHQQLRVKIIDCGGLPQIQSNTLYQTLYDG